MRTWLKEKREDAGFSMSLIARKLDISESYYCMIEKGERQKNLDFSLVVKLSEIFNVPLNTIADYETAEEGA